MSPRLPRPACLLLFALSACATVDDKPACSPEVDPDCGEDTAPDSGPEDTEVAETDPDTAPCTLHADADGDGFGDPATTTCDGVADGSDCDDTRADVNPSAAETCDGADQDCDGAIDDGAADAFLDADGDSFGDPAAPVCASTQGSAANGDDCDDTDATVFPGAPEVCDGQANDCAGDGSVDADGVCHMDLDVAAQSRLRGAVQDQGAGTPSRAGDLDGDGTPELVVFSYGPAFVVSGAVALASAEVDLSLHGVALDSNLAGRGWYAWFAGDAVPDQDGDGCDELLLGEPNSGSGVGEAWIVRGLPSSGALDDVAAAHLYTSTGDWPGVGSDVATAGDVAGDGSTKLLVGAPSEDDANGVVWLLDATATGEIDLAVDAEAAFRSELKWASLGATVAHAGDVDGDGLDDLLLGGPQAEVELSREGVVWLVRGPVSGSTDLAVADAVLRGGADSAMYGNGLAGLGDADGDGLDDFAIGATANAGAGWIDVWSGTVRGEHAAGEATATVQGASRQGFGASVAGPGDIDSDGLADLAVAASGYDNDGATFLWRGLPRGSTSPEDADVILYTDAPLGGAEVAAAGDLDGDGRPDLLVGADRDSTDVRYGGSATLVLGGRWGE